MATKEKPGQPSARAFSFRSGTRINDTVIACDATGAADLLFVSSARTLVRSARRRGRTRIGRTQILTTLETLALSGNEGDRLRARSLVVAPGHPFTLGTLRLELLPSGHLPGGAALACETPSRRILYAGAARLGTPAWGAAPGAVRPADAVCIDATFGHPRFTFVAREQAEADVCRFVRSARDAGCAPLLLVDVFGPAQDLAPALAAAGWKLRAHRSVIAAAAAYRRAGVTVPPITRFAGALAADEVLLWPPAERKAGRLGLLGPTRAAWVSGWSSDAAATESMAANLAIPYCGHADFAGLIAYVTATGAREVAVEHGFAEDFAAALRERAIDAYVLGPPRQIPLPY